MDHNIVVALCTGNLQRIFKFVFFFAFFLLYIEPEMAAGGRFGERFKMRAERPFWSRRELFVIIWPMQTLSYVPVFLDNAEPSLPKGIDNFKMTMVKNIILRWYSDGYHGR